MGVFAKWLGKKEGNCVKPNFSGGTKNRLSFNMGGENCEFVFQTFRQLILYHQMKWI
jgi:hypothetical protein